MSKVLVIGAGGVGTVVVHKLAQNTDVFTEIMLASRTKSKCDNVAADIKKRYGVEIKTAQVDADNVPELVALFKSFQPKLVINVALPYQDLTIMDACLEAGCNYLDTANYEPLDEAKFEYSWQWAYQDKFKEAGLTAILGCGFDPGQTGVYTAYAAKHYFDEITHSDKFIPEDEFTEERRNALLDENPNLIIQKNTQMMEISAEDREAYDKLCHRYEFPGDRPQRIVYIGTRSRSDSRSYSMTSLEFRTKAQRAREWRRNRYPSNSCFLVYDFSKRESSAYLYDCIEFCLSIITFCINEIQTDDLKPHQLYHIWLEIEKERIASTLFEQMQRLGRGELYLKQQLRELSEVTGASDLNFIPELRMDVASYDSREMMDCINPNVVPEDSMRAITESQRQIDLAAIRLRQRIEGYRHHQEVIDLDAYQYAYLPLRKADEE